MDDTNTTPAAVSPSAPPRDLDELIFQGEPWLVSDRLTPESRFYAGNPRLPFTFLPNSDIIIRLSLHIPFQEFI